MVRRSRREAFTLIELLVVMGISAVLLALLLPAVQNAREAANRTTCQNNLKQIGLGLHHYHDSYQGFPPGYTASQPSGDPNFSTSPGWGWATYLLPYVEQGPLFSRLSDAVAAKLPMTDPSVASAIQTRIPLYLCPSDMVPQDLEPLRSLAGQTAYPLVYSDSKPGTIVTGPSSYAACVGRDEDSDAGGIAGSGIFYCNSRTRIGDVLDGTSYTILVGERAWCNANGVWAGAIPDCAMTFGIHNSGLLAISGGMQNSPICAPPMLVQAHAHQVNPTIDSDGGLDDFSSLHPGGANILFADGSVHFVKKTRPDPNPGAPGALPSPYPAPQGTPGRWYWQSTLDYMGYGTRAGGEVVPSPD